MRNHLTITLPSVIDMIPTTQIGQAHYVNDEQPISINKAVETIAKYFKREFEFSSLQYVAHEKKGNPKMDAYVWVDENWSDKFAVGACAFAYITEVNEKEQWVMQFVWFHPYYRNKGLLAASWKGFEEKYGKDFPLEPPISKAMQAFMNKMRSRNES